VGAFGEPDLHFNPQISADGTKIAFNVLDVGTQTSQIWIGDLTRGVRTRLTTGPASNSGAIWSPDSSQIAFQSDRKYQADVFLRPVDGSGAEVALTDEEGQKIPQDWSSDGKFLVILDREPAGERKQKISYMSLTGDRKPVTIVPPVPGALVNARLSPDGRWLLYESDESGRREVYAVSFPEGGSKIQISSAGGRGPRWSRRGREILYISFDETVMSAEVQPGGRLRVGSPKTLFSLPEGTLFGWDAALDGELFLVNVPVIKSSSVPLTLVVNWQAALAR
jgi:Tol biopolymer transport system component